MSGLVLTITEAGRAALVNAANTGTEAVLLASVGVSAASFTPSPAATSLPGEIKRISTLAGEAVADDTVHVTVRDESSAVYTVRSFGLYLSDGTLFAVYSQPEPIMEKSAQAMLLLALDVAFADIDATQITFGDTSFLNPPATTERQGVVELATLEETDAGNDATRAVHPKGLKAAVTNWLNARFGEGAPSSFIKGLLTSASAAALRASLGIKSAALKDEGADKGLDADKLDGEEGTFYRNAANLNAGTVPTARLSGTYNISVSGNAATATKLATARTLSLTGDVTGSASFDGSANAGISVTLAAAKVLEKLRTVDGSGSGVDADTVDGYQAADFARWSGGLFTGSINFSKSHGVQFQGFAALFEVADATVLRSVGTGGISFRASSNAVLLSLSETGVLSRQGYRVWDAGNDGSGSGMDADMLDGLHASAFARLSGAAFTGAISVPLGSAFSFGSHPALSMSSNGAGLFLVSGTGNFILQNAARTANNLTVDNATGSLSARGKITSGGHVEVPDGAAFVSNGKPVLREAGGGTWLYSAGVNGYSFRNSANTVTIAAISDDGYANFAGLTRAFNTVWDAGNDGSGSGLDADLLDGLHAADFAKLADFIASKTTNGYCRLPNGMILQAGRFSAVNDSTVTVTFPIAFPNMCMGVVVSGTAHLKADAQDNNPAVRNGSVTLTSFQVFNAADTTQAFFLAFGW